MISSSVEIGPSAAWGHRPIRLYSSDMSNYYYTCSSEGQIVGWNKQLQPIIRIDRSLRSREQLLGLVIMSLKMPYEVTFNRKIVMLHRKTNSVLLSIVNEHNGVCVCSLTLEDLPPHNNPVVGLVAIPIDSKFVLILAQESLFLFDVWLMKVVGQVQPEKESFSKFVIASITNQKELQIHESSGRGIRFNYEALFRDSLCDLKLNLVSLQKLHQDNLDIVTALKVAKGEVYYNKTAQMHEQINAAILREIKIKIETEPNTLCRQLLSTSFVTNFAGVEQILGNQIFSTANLSFVKGTNLFYFMGTKSGQIFGLPCLAEIGQSYFILQDKCSEYSVESIILNQRLLIVSCADGTLVIYQIEKYSALVYKALNERHTDVLIIGLVPIRSLSTLLPSSILKELPIYDPHFGRVDSKISAYLLADGTAMVFLHESRDMLHLKGSSNKIYCVLEINQYYGLCTEQGLQLFTPFGFERFISYEIWNFQDYSCFAIPLQKKFSESKLVNGKQLIAFSTKQILCQPTLVADVSQDLPKTPQANLLLLASQSLENYSLFCNNYMAVLTTNRSYALSIDWAKQMRNFSKDRRSLQQIIADHSLFFALMHSQISFKWLAPYSEKAKVFVLRTMEMRQGIDNILTVYHPNASEGAWRQVQNFLIELGLFHALAQKNTHLRQQTEQLGGKRLITNMNGAQLSRNTVMSLSLYAVSKNNFIAQSAFEALSSVARPNVDEIYNIFATNLNQVDNSLSEPLTLAEAAWMVYFSTVLLSKNEVKDTSIFAKGVLKRIAELPKPSFAQKPALFLRMLEVFNKLYKFWKEYLKSQFVAAFVRNLLSLFFCLQSIAKIKGVQQPFDFIFEDETEQSIEHHSSTLICCIKLLLQCYPKRTLKVLSQESKSIQPHELYSSSVIEAIRRLIQDSGNEQKSSKEQAKQSEVRQQLIKIMIQCLSERNLTHRSYTKQALLAALQLMSCERICSFSDDGSKFAIQHQTEVTVYCLRTARIHSTISIEKILKGEAKLYWLELSPKGRYIAILTDALHVWKLEPELRHSSHIVFEGKGHSLKWEHNEESITVTNPNPSRNCMFQI